MKKKSIIALAVLSFYAGAANFVKAQDSTMSFGKYLIKTPWIVTAGVSHVSDDNVWNPFNTSLKTPQFYTKRNHLYPSVFSVEKSLYDYKKWGWSKALTFQARVSREGGRPLFFGVVEGNIKYNFRAHFENNEKLKWFDPYALVGVGISEFFIEQQVYLGVGKLYYNGRRRPHVIAHAYGRDRFVTLNTGIGTNIWINKYVGINLEACGRWGKFVEHKLRNRPAEGTNYSQYTIGLVFKIGSSCKNDDSVDNEENKARSNYQRTKEEEDALIHLRQHIEEGEEGIKRIQEQD